MIWTRNNFSQLVHVCKCHVHKLPHVPQIIAVCMIIDVQSAAPTCAPAPLAPWQGSVAGQSKKVSGGKYLKHLAVTGTGYFYRVAALWPELYLPVPGLIMGFCCQVVTGGLWSGIGPFHNTAQSPNLKKNCIANKHWYNLRLNPC